MQDIESIRSTLIQEHSLLTRELLDELRRKSADTSSNDRLSRELEQVRNSLVDAIVRNEGHFQSLQQQLGDIKGGVEGLSDEIQANMTLITRELESLNSRILTINTSIEKLKTSNQENFTALSQQLFQELE